MTEAELQAAVIEAARLLAWKVAHFRPAQNSRGEWRTAVAGDGKGFPDLILASSTTVAFVELKSARGRLSLEQSDWLDVLSQSSIAKVWRPEDWLDGTIEKFLRENS